MEARTIAVAALAGMAMAGSITVRADQTEMVVPRFDKAIPNIPGKSLVVVEVDYPPGAASRRTDMQNRPSSTPMSFRARSSPR